MTLEHNIYKIINKLNYITSSHLLFLSIIFGVIGVLFRIYISQIGVFWFDEVVNLEIARLPIIEMLSLQKSDFSPPLHNILLHFWINFIGDTDSQLQLFPIFWWVIASIGASFTTYKWCQDRFVVFTVTLLMFLSPLIIHYSVEVRMYSMLMALGVWSSWILTELTEKKGYIIPFILLNTIGLYTHNSWVFILISFFVYALLYLRVSYSRELIIKFTVCFATITILYLPLFIFITSKQLERITSSGLEYIYMYYPTMNIVVFLLTEASTFITLDTKTTFEMTILGVSAYGLYAPIRNILNSITKRVSISTTNRHVLLALLLFIIPAIIFCLSVKTLVIKYLIFSAFPLYFLVAFGLSKVFSDKTRFAVLWLFILLLFNGNFELANKRKNDNLRQSDLVIKKINADLTEGDVILVVPALYNKGLQRYSDSSIPIIDFDPHSIKSDGTVDQQRLLANGGRTHLINQDNIHLLDKFLDSYTRVWYYTAVTQVDSDEFVMERLLQTRKFIKVVRVGNNHNHRIALFGEKISYNQIQN